MNKTQEKFGTDIITEASKRWNISPIQAAEIMKDVDLILGHWKWVHMEDFLDIYIKNNKTTKE